MVSLQALDVPPTRPASSSSTRNEALDFTKGSLVLFMVLYHWLNYFVDLGWDAYRYLRFLTPSFILITGFLVTNVYLGKYSPTDRHLHRRLFERGAKLLLLFTLLNLFANMTVSSGSDGASRSLWAGAYAIYVTGNGKAAFDVLVPISYFLLLSPILLMVFSVSRFALPTIAAVGLAVAILTSTAGVGSANLELVTMAIVGMTIGTKPLDHINRIVQRPGLIVVAYALYLVAITRWNILFPLQVVGVCLSLLLIYCLGVKCDESRGPQAWVVMLGQYSLFTYIVHILVLQVFRRTLRDFDLSGAALMIPLVATVMVLVLTVQLVRRTRTRSSTVDRLYRVVFA